MKNTNIMSALLLLFACTIFFNDYTQIVSNADRTCIEMINQYDLYNDYAVRGIPYHDKSFNKESEFSIYDGFFVLTDSDITGLSYNNEEFYPFSN